MRLTIPALVLVLMTACSPYRIDVRQGNLVTQEMVDQLRPGMTRDQVRFVLGTPLVTDMFHADRWDYVYRFQPGRGEVQQRRVTVFFENGVLARVDGQGAPVDPASKARVIDLGGSQNAAGADSKPGTWRGVATDKLKEGEQ